MIQKLVGGKIYKEIEIDERVRPGLEYCLHCEIIDIDSKQRVDYNLPLQYINPFVRQCVACKRIYILGDVTEPK